MKHGALVKVTIWCVVAVSIILSGYLDTDLTSYIVGYYLVMEMISILENVSVFIPVPDKIKNILNDDRSEEHTSELQSRFDLVCRLLLEKKKKEQKCEQKQILIIRQCENHESES